MILGPDGMPTKRLPAEQRSVGKYNISYIPRHGTPAAMQAVRKLIREVQEKIDPEIWATFYPEKNLVVFLRRGIIVEKIQLDAESIFKDSFVPRKLRRIRLRLTALNTLNGGLLKSIKNQVQRLRLGRKLYGE